MITTHLRHLLPCFFVLLLCLGTTAGTTAFAGVDIQIPAKPAEEERASARETDPSDAEERDEESEESTEQSDTEDTPESQERDEESTEQSETEDTSETQEHDTTPEESPEPDTKAKSKSSNEISEEDALTALHEEQQRKRYNTIVSIEAIILQNIFDHGDRKRWDPVKAYHLLYCNLGSNPKAAEMIGLMIKDKNREGLLAVVALTTSELIDPDKTPITSALHVKLVFVEAMRKFDRDEKKMLLNSFSTIFPTKYLRLTEQTSVINLKKSLEKKNDEAVSDIEGILLAYYHEQMNPSQESTHQESPHITNLMMAKERSSPTKDYIE